jgi:hypothetical protein
LLVVPATSLLAVKSIIHNAYSLPCGTKDTVTDKAGRQRPIKRLSKSRNLQHYLNLIITRVFAQ